MSSLQGTTQAYQPMGSTYIALAPSCGDRLFGSGIDYCNLVGWGIYDGQEKDPRVLQKYLNDENRDLKALTKLGSAAMIQAADENSAVDYSSSISNQTTSVWSLLQSLPQLSTMKKLVERSGWDKYISSANSLYKITLFAPTNQAFASSPIAYQHTNPRDLRLIAEAHTLPFSFDQNSAYGRKLRLYTSLEAFSVYLDGTGEVQNNLNFFIPSNELKAFTYPKPLKRINILQGYYTNNGALYEIDGIFEPQVYVT
jgi:hypothetical protein